MLHRAEPEPGVQAEQAQAEDFANLALDEGKHQCINQCSLPFILNISLCFTLIVH
jgi:hypothetical protein